MTPTQHPTQFFCFSKWSHHVTQEALGQLRNVPVDTSVKSLGAIPFCIYLWLQTRPLRTTMATVIQQARATTAFVQKAGSIDMHDSRWPPCYTLTAYMWNPLHSMLELRMVNSVFRSFTLQDINSLRVILQSWVCTSDIGEEGKSSLLGDEAAGPVLGRMEADDKSKLFWSVTTSCIYVEISEIPNIRDWRFWMWHCDTQSDSEVGTTLTLLSVAGMECGSKGNMKGLQTSRQNTIHQHASPNMSHVSENTEPMTLQIWMPKATVSYDLVIVRFVCLAHLGSLICPGRSPWNRNLHRFRWPCAASWHWTLASHGRRRTLHVWHGSWDAAFRTVVYFTAYLLLTGGSI